MWAQWANDYGIANLWAKIVPMNLIWSESTQWLLISGLCKIPGALIYAHGHAMWAWWANDHDVVHLQAKTVPITLICNESAQWLLSYSVHDFQPVKWTNGQTDGDNSIVTFFLQKRKGHKSISLFMFYIALVINYLGDHLSQWHKLAWCTSS